MKKKGIGFVLLTVLFWGFQGFSQVSMHTSLDYQLLGYPSSVRYMKWESADSTLINQRTSFIDDYQLVFNENRQLVERINYINGQKDRYTKYEYDNNRHLVRETLMEANNKIVSVTTYKYNYIGRVAEIEVVDYPQSRGGANTVVRKEYYEYRDNGQVSKYKVFSDNRKDSRETSYFYGPQDSLIYTITTYSYNKNVDRVNYKRDYKHDVIEKTVIRNDKQTRRETYQYNEKGLLKEKTIYNRNDEKLLTYSYKYDQHNYMTEETAIDNKGVKTIEYYYKYEKDQYFNWTKRVTYDGWEEKYTEKRDIKYLDKEHWYEDLKDAETKRVIRGN